MHNVFRQIKTEIQFLRTAGLNYSAHIHEDIELVYIKRGSGIAFCDGKKYILSENSFF